MEKTKQEIVADTVSDTTEAPTASTRVVPVTSHLIGKNELLRLLALARATGLPLLFVGDKGVAKTQTFTTFAQAILSSDEGRQLNEREALLHPGLFILETNPHTRSSEVVGRVDVKKLVTEKEYQLLSPITSAKYVLINEIDKAGGAVRDALLSIMNEKVVFNGHEKVPCVWDMFVATCNSIPEDEIGNHFWDRFVLKYHVSRISASQVLKIFNGLPARTLNLKIPTFQEIMDVEIPEEKLSKFLDVCYKKTSDRTLTKVPMIAKAISIIWGVDINQSLVKTAEIICGKNEANNLSQTLLSPEMKGILNEINMLQMISDESQIDSKVDDIQKKVESLVRTGKFTSNDVKEINAVMQSILARVTDEDGGDDED